MASLNVWVYDASTKKPIPGAYITGTMGGGACAKDWLGHDVSGCTCSGGTTQTYSGATDSAGGFYFNLAYNCNGQSITYKVSASGYADQSKQDTTGNITGDINYYHYMSPNLTGGSGQLQSTGSATSIYSGWNIGVATGVNNAVQEFYNILNNPLSTVTIIVIAVVIAIVVIGIIVLAVEV